MILRRERENVFMLTLAGQELSALIAAARMARDMLEHDPDAPPEAAALLARLLSEYDAALARLGRHDGGGRNAPAS